MTPLLSIEGIHLSYAGKNVVNNISCQLQPGEIGCLLGPSGCGKTTLLRAVAGFEPVRSGKILLGDKEISRPGWSLVPEKRSIGMVFQDFALFPHLNVEKNIAFGINHLPAQKRRNRIHELLDLVGLPEYANSYPHQLSSGQQQRVAIARALAPRPQLLLLDEPFSNLDVELRETLARQVRDILRHEGLSAILVTHDQLEAFAFADSIHVISDGRIMQRGTGYQLYYEPANRFVAEFIGQGELLPAELRNAHQIHSDFGVMDGSGCEHLPKDSRVELLIRPDQIVHNANGIEARIVEKLYRGAEFLYTLTLPSDCNVLYLAPGMEDLPVNTAIPITLNTDRIIVISGETTSVFNFAPEINSGLTNASQSRAQNS